MQNFIYVFSEEDKDLLLELGYDLITSNGDCIFVFANKPDQAFANSAINFVASDILTF